MATTESDHKLLSAYQRGHLRAFEAIYARYAPRLLGYARSMLGDHDAAEDVLQQLFAAFIRRAPHLPAQTRLRAYLFTAARNHVANAHRSQHRRTNFSQKYEAFVRWRGYQPTGPAQRAEADELRIMIDRVLATLSPVEREAVLLRTQGGMTFTEIAEALGTPRGTVATRYRTAIGKLRKLLAKDDSKQWTSAT